MNNIKNCPKCKTLYPNCSTVLDKSIISCPNCGLSTPVVGTYKLAEEIWNDNIWRKSNRIFSNELKEFSNNLSTILDNIELKDKEKFFILVRYNSFIYDIIIENNVKTLIDIKILFTNSLINDLDIGLISSNKDSIMSYKFSREAINYF